MTMVVLQNKAQINSARLELDRRGLSSLDSPWQSLLRKVGLLRGPSIGDMVKSWDILSTVQFLEQHVSKDGVIVDIGAYASEILVSLERLGYRRLVGIDLNPKLRDLPQSGAIRYEVSDFMRTPLESASCDAITAISVIEHGFQPAALATEVSRLLKPRGYFIASFDYWPAKTDTQGIKFFGMDWLIFSREDVAAFVAEAARHGLTPAGPMQFEASDRPIDCAGKKYTFGWVVFQKTA